MRWIREEQELDALLFEEGMREMSIAEKLAWEIQAQNDLGEASARQKLALEICYGVALVSGGPDIFSSAMESITNQVTDAEMVRLLQVYTRRGLKGA